MVNLVTNSVGHQGNYTTCGEGQDEKVLALSLAATRLTYNTWRRTETEQLAIILATTSLVVSTTQTNDTWWRTRVQVAVSIATNSLVLVTRPTYLVLATSKRREEDNRW